MIVIKRLVFLLVVLILATGYSLVVKNLKPVSPTVAPKQAIAEVSQILENPLDYKNKEAVIIGCSVPLTEINPSVFPLSKSHWVIKDTSGVIPVLGWPEDKEGKQSKIDLSANCMKYFRLSGVVTLTFKNQPYIVPKDIIEWGEAILPISETQFPSDCNPGSWEGVIKICSANEAPLYNPNFCQDNKYFLELQGEGRAGFNYKDFENLELIVGKGVFLVGCTVSVVPIISGNLKYITKIIP